MILADIILRAACPSTPVSRIGVYQIVGAIGAGGMGDVYRAHDPALGRDVAIKVLPDAFAADAERLARFEREARVLASLNHPNIAAIYGLERTTAATCLVMELAAGETLAARIARGPVPLDEAVVIALQIASALAAAHEKGIVHRDLKPANIVVAADGQVKVLDFGLAKAVETGHMAPQDLTHSPTIYGGTTAGVLLGTAAYMSPEQARGKAVDVRTDVWAFGCIVFEMLTRRSPFAGDTLTDILALVVRSDPDWTALAAAAPPSVIRVLRRCLEKDASRRYHSIADVRIDIEECSVSVTRPPEARHASTRTRLVLACATTALITVALMLAVTEKTKSGLPTVVRLELNMPPHVEVPTTNSPNIAISADGSQIAYAGVLDGVRRLYVRRADASEATPLSGTDSINVCVFSPDGRSAAFITNDRELKRVSLADGLVTTVTGDVDFLGGLAWGSKDRLTFARGGTLWQIAASGGAATQLTHLDPGGGEAHHTHPWTLSQPDAVLFATVLAGDRARTNIEVLSLATGRRRVLIENGSSPMYANSGHLVFFRDGELLGAPVDPKTRQVTGPAAAVLRNVTLDQFGNPMVSFSSSGTLAYVPTSSATKRLVWVSRQGVESPITDAPRPYQNPRLQPNQSRIVVEIAGGYLWLHDIIRGTFTRLTSDVLGNTFPVWVPDGRSVVYRTVVGVRQVDADGSGRARTIAGTTLTDIPTSVSPDGRTLAFIRQSAAGGGDVYVLSLDGDPQPHPLIQTSGYDGGAQFSPDGRWIAYVTNESGQFEVFVRPYPGPDRRIQVSTAGGTHPRWSPTGRELFYRLGDKLMAVDVISGPDMTLSKPHVLFEQRYAFGSGQTVANYDVAEGGQRFLMVKDDSASGRLNVVLNWFEELKRLAPPR